MSRLGILGLDGLGLRLDLDGLTRPRNLEGQICGRILINVDSESGTRYFVKAFRFDCDRVRSRSDGAE